MKICTQCGACLDDGYKVCSYDQAELQQPFQGPRVMGDRYLLEQRIAQGAMGQVFRATHLQIGSTVAVKICSPNKRRCALLWLDFIAKRRSWANQTPQCDFGDGLWC